MVEIRDRTVIFLATSQRIANQVEQMLKKGSMTIIIGNPKHWNRDQMIRKSEEGLKIVKMITRSFRIQRQILEI